MTATGFNTILAAAIACLLAVAATALFIPFRRRRKKKTIRLGDLAVLWTKDGKAQVHIAELTPLWRSEEPVPDGPDLDEIKFTISRLREFAERHIRDASWFRKASAQARIAIAILQLLDREGGRPSVVNIAGDVESKWDTTTYATLGKVTLADHTVNVAEETIALLTAAGAHHIIPDALIAALGHDLGKLDSLREYAYSLGEHPLAAGRALAALPEFKALPKKDEILRAVKHHHKMPEGLLGKTVQKADQTARQKELEAHEEAAAKEQTTESSSSPAREQLPAPPSAPHPAPEKPPSQTGAEANAAAWRAQADIFGEESGQEKKSPAAGPPKMMDISSWFDARAFLDDIEPYINKMFGRRWMAFSMADGHVYVQAKVLEEIARKHAERAGAMEIATIAPDDPAMRQVLYTVVHHLRVEHQDVIARGLIKDSFFGGYFNVTMRTGKTVKGYYTPFHAEAFGSIADMEARKTGTIREFQSVEPAA